MDPSIDLTPGVVRALTRLRPARHSRRGVNLAMISPLHHWTRAVDGDRLAAHLGITIPTFPVLDALGYRTSCRSDEGEEVFEHPVPSTSHPPPLPSDPAVGAHAVLVVHVAPGVDPGAVALSDGGSVGVGWMRLHYGLPLLQHRDDDDDDDVDDLPNPYVVRLGFRNGDQLWVRGETGPQTRMGWRCTPGDATFDVELALPLPPVDAVRALAVTPGIPLQGDDPRRVGAAGSAHGPPA